MQQSLALRRSCQRAMGEFPVAAWSGPIGVYIEAMQLAHPCSEAARRQES
jgi:hypothetical protein